MSTLKPLDVIFVTNITTGTTERVYILVNPNARFQQIVAADTQDIHVLHRHPRNEAVLLNNNQLTTVYV